MKLTLKSCGVASPSCGIYRSHWFVFWNVEEIGFWIRIPTFCHCQSYRAVNKKKKAMMTNCRLLKQIDPNFAFFVVFKVKLELEIIPYLSDPAKWFHTILKYQKIMKPVQ